MNSIWDQLFLGNSILSYTWFVGIVLFGVLFKTFLSKFLSKLCYNVVKKYAEDLSFDHFLELVKKPFGTFILLIIFYLAFDRLEFPHEWKLVPVEKFGLRMIAFKGFQVGIVFSITWILMRVVDFFALIVVHKASLTNSKTDDQIVPFLREGVKIILVILSLFFIMGTVFDVNIASLIAGLGIGGLAIALAAKETLENLLGSFTIFLDKPFHVGDVIQFGNTTGTVERIGFRSTRLRTPEKSMLTVPNKNLVDAQLDNLSERLERRVHMYLNFAHNNTAEQLKKTILEIEYYIELHQHTTSEFKIRIEDFSNFSYTMLIHYFIKPIDWNTYIDIRHEINLKILDIIQQNNCSLTAPASN